MKKTLFSGVALAAMMAFSGAAYADILIGVAGPITGPNAALARSSKKAPSRQPLTSMPPAASTAK